MFCAQCGKEVRKEAKFCVHCGAKIEDYGESKPADIPEERLSEPEPIEVLLNNSEEVIKVSPKPQGHVSRASIAMVAIAGAILVVGVYWFLDDLMLNGWLVSDLAIDILLFAAPAFLMTLFAFINANKQRKLTSTAGTRAVFIISLIAFGISIIVLILLILLIFGVMDGNIYGNEWYDFRGDTYL